MNRTTSWMACFMAAALALPVAANDAPFEAAKGTRRAESRTPPGKVAPPPARTGGQASLPGEQEYLAEPGEEAPADDGSADIAAFASAYAKGGAPRMAVYFNRVLSAEVREWVPGDRHQSEIKTSQSAEASSSSIGTLKAGSDQASIKTESSASTDTRSKYYVGPTGGREDPAETWKWEFEDAVTSAFLEADANIVDRAVIFRLMAKQNPQTAGMDGVISTNLNETSALEKYADVLIELKVTAATGSVVGYQFKATAKSVKTGRVLGTAYVNGDPRPDEGKKEWVATSKGYEKVSTEAFTVASVSRELAAKLMRSMAPRMAKS